MKINTKRFILRTLTTIVAAVAVLVALLLLLKNSVILQGVTHVSLAEDSMYIVDLDSTEDEYWIIRTDLNGQNGAAIYFDQYDIDYSYQIRQIFLDDEGEAYVLIEMADLDTMEETSPAIYHCNFSNLTLEETDYDLSVASAVQVQIQGIRDGKLYFFSVGDGEVFRGIGMRDRAVGKDGSNRRDRSGVSGSEVAVFPE